MRSLIAGSMIGLLALISSPSAIAQSPVTEKHGHASQSAKTVIARIWHGKTPTVKAEEYYAYLKEAGIEKIKRIEGNLGVQVFRHTEKEFTEFTVISYWESMTAVRRFAGADVEKTHNLPKDPEYLIDLEPTVKHYEVVLNDWK